MDAIPTRDLTPLERAIQAFNSGADPSAGALQCALLDAEVNALSPSEPGVGEPPKILALDGGDGETYLQVFTHEDRIDLELARKFPVMLRMAGDKLVVFATEGITINPGSDSSLAVAVKSGGVHQMREIVRSRQAAEEARAARPAHEIETAIAAVDRTDMDAVGALRFAADLWPATLFVPSHRPLTSDTEIDLDACFTFGPDDDRMLAAFTDPDQLADFASAHLLEITGGELFHRLPDGTGVFFNPKRADQLPLTGQGMRTLATLIEHRMPPANPT